MAANVQVNGGPAGNGTLAAPVNVSVALVDVGGGSPQTRAWTIQRWPAPLASPPAVTGASLSSASFTPALDGLYQVELSRLEADGVTTTRSRVLVGVPNAAGRVFPSPGVDDQLFAALSPSDVDQAAAARLAGQLGSAAGGTDVLLDAETRDAHAVARGALRAGTSGKDGDMAPFFVNDARTPVSFGGARLWFFVDLAASGGTNYTTVSLHLNPTADLSDLTGDVLVSSLDTKTTSYTAWRPVTLAPSFSVPPGGCLWLHVVKSGGSPPADTPFLVVTK